MSGFGFIEYEDSMDARDVVPGESLLLSLSLGYLVYSVTDSCIVSCSISYVALYLRYFLIFNPPIIDGTDFKGERLTVQFARGPRHKENFNGPPDRSNHPRPRRTVFRMQISGLPETSWQVSSTPLLPGSFGHSFVRTSSHSWPNLVPQIQIPAH